MGAVIPIGLRGLLWLATSFGLGSLFGGDKIETQNIVASTTWWEKLLWALLGAGVVLAIFWLIRKIAGFASSGKLNLKRGKYVILLALLPVVNDLSAQVMQSQELKIGTSVSTFSSTSRSTLNSAVTTFLQANRDMAVLGLSFNEVVEPAVGSISNMEYQMGYANMATAIGSMRTYLSGTAASYYVYDFDVIQDPGAATWGYKVKYATTLRTVYYCNLVWTENSRYLARVKQLNLIR